MITDVINEYKNLTMHVSDIIDRSGYRVDYVCDKLGMSKPGFYKKRKAGNFTPDEMLKLLKILKVEDIEYHLFVELMEKSKQSEKLSEKQTKALFDSLA